MTHEDELKQFKNWLTISKAESTAKSCYSVAKSLLEHVNKPPREITLEDATDFIVKKQKQLSRSSIPVMVGRLKTFFKFYGKHDIANMLPVPRLKEGEEEARLRNIKWLPEESIEVLLSNCFRRELPIIQTAYHFALRVGEVTKLRKSWIDHKNRTMKIYRLKTRYPYQELPFDHEETKIHDTYPTLMAYLATRRDDSDTLFITGPKGFRKDAYSPLSVRQLEYYVLTALERAAPEDATIRKLLDDRWHVSFHLLRNSKATNIVINTILQGKPVSLYKVQSWLGHKRQEHTLRYIHLAGQYLGKDLMKKGDVIL